MNDYNQTAALALAKCAGNDPWFPQPNRATVEAWAEQIAVYDLETADVLEAVALAYRDNGSGFRPLPHDIVQRARDVRRDRTQRESRAEREAREDRQDAALEQRNCARMQQVARGFGKAIDA